MNQTVKTKRPLIYTAAELMAMDLGPYGPLDEAAHDAALAAELLRELAEGQDPEGTRIDSIAWRLADALLLLAQYTREQYPGCPTPGVDFPTGRGAMLSNERRY